MKYQTCKKDLKEIETQMSGHEILFLKSLKNQKFNVGDILIKKTFEFDDNKISGEYVEMYDNSILPRRYLIIHADEDSSFYFYRNIDENGKLESEIYNTFSTDHLGYEECSIFEVDPIFLDAVILGEEFDIGHLLKEEKERKSKLIKMNRSSSIALVNLKHVNEYISSLKEGDMLYYHDAENFNDNCYYTMCIKKPRKSKIETYLKTKRWTKYNYRKINKAALNDKYVFYIKDLSKTRLITSDDLIGKAIYKNKPIDLKGQL